MQISIARIRFRALHILLAAGLQSAELIERDGSRILDRTKGNPAAHCLTGCLVNRPRPTGELDLDRCVGRERYILPHAKDGGVHSLNRAHRGEAERDRP
jgi:hypothetical protein